MHLVSCGNLLIKGMFKVPVFPIFFSQRTSTETVVGPEVCVRVFACLLMIYFFSFVKHLIVLHDTQNRGSR